MPPLLTRSLPASLGMFAGHLGHRFPAAAEALLSEFAAAAAPTEDSYARLFEYFLTGFLTYRSRLGAHARYPGLGSYNGPAMDRLEGYSRIAPLLAAWLHGGRPRILRLVDGRFADLVELLGSGVLAGTDPAGREYWGDIRHWQQSVVEAADIALSLWLTRALFWDELGGTERARIVAWLNQVNNKRIPDNNWHLFVVQVNAVLAALGESHDAEEMRRHYQRAKAFYRGEGWFRDGEMKDTPGYDFYNAWGFHYHLQWLRRIDPGWDADFIDEAFAAFVSGYRYLIGPEGLPMMGRSACYRMAAPAPLVFAQEARPDLVSPGQARRALDATWQHFIRRGAVRGGNVTQGYHGRDPRLLENYSGPASCLWSLRSLVAAFALPDEHAFWRAAPQPLPVEISDYRIVIGPPQWTVVGEHSSGRISILTGAGDDPTLQDPALRDRVAEFFSGKPRRPKNIAAKYHRARYESSDPYGTGCRHPTDAVTAAPTVTSPSARTKA